MHDDSSDEFEYPALDRDTQKKLKKIEDNWNLKRPTSIDYNELQIMLKYFEPLRASVRSIVGFGAREDLRHVEEQGRGPSSQPLQSYKLLEDEIDRLKNDNLSLKKNLSDCSEAFKGSEAKASRLESLLGQKESELKKFQSELTQLENRLAEAGDLPAALCLVRDDPELAKRMELDHWPDDAQAALIRAVAVLSQRANVERLWEALKDRCEENHRAVTTDEIALLKLAISWLNHNWPKSPVGLLLQQSPLSYDFHRHNRSRDCTTGEQVIEIRLPGLLDGLKKVIYKSVVITRE